MSDVRILQGDCRDVMRTLPAASVHCCVTSPPYWALRDYGLPPSVWGGDAACAHEWGANGRLHKGGPHGDGVLKYGGRGVIAAQAATKDIDTGSFCTLCGAWRGQLGLEPTPQLYVDHIVEVMREVRRVLRKDGTLWLNLGDCYNGAGLSGGTKPAIPGTLSFRGAIGSGRIDAGLKPKDLVMVPARVALALQSDGWWIRSDIIWSKPNPMPESVTDRPTKAHEYLFLLSQAERYYYDHEAILEPAGYAHEAQWDNGENGHGGGVSHAGQGSSTRKFRKSGNKTRKHGDAVGRQGSGSHLGRSIPWEGEKRNKRSVWTVSEDEFEQFLIWKAEQLRNKADVWTVTTKPFKDAHFATFPPKLIKPCILAGCPEDGTVLDPFGGSGTVGEVCRLLGRDAIIIDLNPNYIGMATRRTDNALGPLFAPQRNGST